MRTKGGSGSIFQKVCLRVSGSRSRFTRTTRTPSSLFPRRVPSFDVPWMEGSLFSEVATGETTGSGSRGGCPTSTAIFTCSARPWPPTPPTRSGSMWEPVLVRSFSAPMKGTAGRFSSIVFLPSTLSAAPSSERSSRLSTPIRKPALSTHFRKIRGSGPYQRRIDL